MGQWLAYTLISEGNGGCRLNSFKVVPFSSASPSPVTAVVRAALRAAPHGPYTLARVSWPSADCRPHSLPPPPVLGRLENEDPNKFSGPTTGLDTAESCEHFPSPAPGRLLLCQFTSQGSQSASVSEALTVLGEQAAVVPESQLDTWFTVHIFVCCLVFCDFCFLTCGMRVRLPPSCAVGQVVKTVLMLVSSTQ